MKAGLLKSGCLYTEVKLRTKVLHLYSRQQSEYPSGLLIVKVV